MAAPMRSKGAELGQQVSAEQAQAQAIASVALAELDAKLAQVKAQADAERAQIQLRQAQVEAKANPLAERAKAIQQQEKEAQQAALAKAKGKPLPLPEVRPLNLKNPSAPVIQGGASFAPGPEGAIGGAAAQEALQGMQGGQPQMGGGGMPNAVNVAGQNFAAPEMLVSGRVQSETGNQQVTPWFRTPQTTTRTSIDLEPNVLKAFEAARLMQEQQESNRRLDLLAQGTASAMIRDFGETFHAKDWGAAFSLARAQASGDWQGVDAALTRMGKTLPEERHEGILATQRASMAESAARIRAADADTIRTNLDSARIMAQMRFLENGGGEGAANGGISIWDVLNPNRPRTRTVDRQGNVKLSDPQGMLTAEQAMNAWKSSFDKDGNLIQGKSALAAQAVDRFAYDGLIPTLTKGEGWGSDPISSMIPLNQAFDLMDKAVTGDNAAREALRSMGLVEDFGRNGLSPRPTTGNNAHASEWFVGAYSSYNDLRAKSGAGQVGIAPPAPQPTPEPTRVAPPAAPPAELTSGGNLAELAGQPRASVSGEVNKLLEGVRARDEAARQKLRSLNFK